MDQVTSLYTTVSVVSVIVKVDAADITQGVYDVEIF
jgi:hypothetical protein